MRKIDLEIGLKGEFKARNWQFESIAKLPPAFARATTVTPFFQPRVIRRSDAHYLIDGYLGVVNRMFERHWTQTCSEAVKHNSHCLALNIANIDTLRAQQHIETTRLGERISQFCNLILAELEALPYDEASFRSALDGNVLMGLPLEKFAILGRAKKFSCLRTFMEKP